MTKDFRKQICAAKARTMRLLLAAAILATAVTAASLAAGAQTNPESAPEAGERAPAAGDDLPAEVQRTLDSVLGMPPEVTSRVLLAISGSRATPNALSVSLRRRLARQAFDLALQARFPYRLEAVNTLSTAMRSVEGMQFLSLATVYEGDALSLQCRAVETTLRFDAEAAAEMFTQIPLPASAAPSCTGFLLPETSVYYRTLASVLRQRGALSEEMRARLLGLARDAATSTQNVAELVGLLSLVSTPDWAGEEQGDLLELTAAAITRIPGTEQTPWRHYEVAQRSALSLQPSGTANLARAAWADLLARQANAVGCEAERGEDQVVADRSRLRLMKEAIADGMVVPQRSPHVAGMNFPSLGRPVGTDGYAVRALFNDKFSQELLQSNPSLAAHARLAALPSSPEGPPSAVGAALRTRRLSEAADADFRKFLEKFEKFRADADIHSEVRFHEICQIFSIALQSAPDERARLEQLDLYSKYLAVTPLMRVDPPSWMRYAQLALSYWNASRSQPGQQKKEAHGEPPASIAVLGIIWPGARILPMVTRGRGKGPEQSPAP